MKKQRRVTALAMSSALALSTLTGCPGNKDKDETTMAAVISTTAEPTTEASAAETAKPTQTTEAPTEEPTKWAGPLTTFKSRTIEFVTSKQVVFDGSWHDGLLMSSGQEPVNQYQEDLRDFLNEIIMKRNNFSVGLKTIGRSGEDYASSLTMSITAGEPLGHLCEIEPRWIPALMNNGLLKRLDELSALDLTEEKWNKNVLEETSFGGHIYGMNSVSDLGFGYGVFFNKRLLQEAGYGTDKLYDLQKNGKWNRTTFEEILKACTKDTNGDGKTDIWGMSTSLGAHYYTAMIHASGADFVTKDAFGKIVNQMGSEEFIATLTWAEKMWKEYSAPPMEDEWASPYERFNRGETALLIGTEADRQKFSPKDDWGFLLLPAPDGQENVSVDASTVVFIPASYSNEEANEIAFVFDKLTDPLPGMCDGTDAFKEFYYPWYNDPRAVDETLYSMRYGKNIKPRLELSVQGLYYDGIMRDFLYPLFAGETTPEEGIKANMERWDTFIGDQNAVFK